VFASLLYQIITSRNQSKKQATKQPQEQEIPISLKINNQSKENQQQPQKITSNQKAIPLQKNPSFTSNSIIKNENTNFTILQTNKLEPNRIEIDDELEEEEEGEFEDSISFYEDKYVPQYMSNKNLVSTALEYFVEDENSIYGRVKL
jgi:hypothetical protein